MSGAKRARAAALVGVALSTGCVPQVSTKLDVPAAIPTTTLFGCAEAVVQDLNAVDGHWHRRVTLRNAADGRLETGEFARPNVMGYRIRLVRPAGASHASIDVRAAGPHFSDPGAQRALASFQTALTACVARSPSARAQLTSGK